MTGGVHRRHAADAEQTVQLPFLVPQRAQACVCVAAQIARTRRRIVAVLLGLALLIIAGLTRTVWVNLLIALALMVLLAPAISVMQRKLRFPRSLAIVTA